MSLTSMSDENVTLSEKLYGLSHSRDSDNNGFQGKNNMMLQNGMSGDDLHQRFPGIIYDNNNNNNHDPPFPSPDLDGQTDQGERPMAIHDQKLPGGDAEHVPPSKRFNEFVGKRNVLPLKPNFHYKMDQSHSPQSKQFSLNNGISRPLIFLNKGRNQSPTSSLKTLSGVPLSSFNRMSFENKERLTSFLNDFLYRTVLSKNTPKRQYDFVGKRNFNPDKSVPHELEELLSKRYDFLGRKRFADFMNKRYDFIGKRSDAEPMTKRYDFLGKRDYDFLGKKNHYTERVIFAKDDSKRSYDLLGKKSYDLLGKRSYDLLGKKSDEPSGKRSYDLLGKKSYDLLGKRSYDLLGKRSYDLLGKRSDYPSEKRSYDLLGKKSYDLLGKRSYDLLGKRSDDPSEKRSYDLLGKKSYDLLGKRSYDLLGKRSDDPSEKRSYDLLGKKSYDLLGKRSYDLIGKRSYDLLGKRSDYPSEKRSYDLLGKKSYDLLGKRSYDLLGKKSYDLLGKRSYAFLGKKSYDFLGKRIPSEIKIKGSAIEDYTVQNTKPTSDGINNKHEEGVKFVVKDIDEEETQEKISASKRYSEWLGKKKRDDMEIVPASHSSSLASQRLAALLRNNTLRKRLSRMLLHSRNDDVSNTPEFIGKR